MRKIVRKVLLPLLFSFCFVFSGFLDVSAFAVSPFEVLYPFDNQSVTLKLFNSSNNSSWSGTITQSASNHQMGFNINGSYSVSSFSLGIPNKYLIYEFYPSVYDYYLCMYANTSAYNINHPNMFSFYPKNVAISDLSCENPSLNYHYLEDLFVLHRDDASSIGFSFSGKLPDTINNQIFSYINVFNDGSNEVISGQWFTFYPFFVVTPKGALDDNGTEFILTKLNELISETNNVEQAVQQLQQAVEEQYSMSPEEDFGVDDVLTQHNEKMGVLSFGSDVMLQFLDMFQNTNPGTAQLTLPGFAITVQNVEYQVWQDQTFNFNQLETWFPSLINIIRLILPAFVWLMVLRYCIGVFERNFLSK